MKLEVLTRAAATERLIDILLVGVIELDECPPKFYQTQGGPIFLQFEATGVVIEQPLGKESIAFSRIGLQEWVRQRQESDPEYRLAVFSVFELFCFRCNFVAPAPTIDQIIVYRPEDGSEVYNGLLLVLSTGGSIGIDPFSDKGLRFFLDHQTFIFDGECISPMKLKKDLVWARTPGMGR